MNICNHCHSQYNSSRINQKYCSVSCRNSHSVSEWRKKTMKCCQQCNNLILKESNLCRECQTKTKELKNVTLGEYKQKLSVKNKHPSWATTHIRLFNRSWNKELLKFGCQKCGYSNHIELAHIKSIRDFSDDSLISVINDPSNILVLCPNHHWEFDNGILNLIDIPSR
jgi:predicted restriction endonuclease